VKIRRPSNALGRTIAWPLGWTIMKKNASLMPRGMGTAGID